jgi:Fic family protein
LPLAAREMQALDAALRGATHYSDLLMHMLNRREAVDSSQIEGTHTQFDELLLHEIELDTPVAADDDDAEQTLNYVKAYAYGVKKVRARTRGGRQALTNNLIRKLHSTLMSGEQRTSPGEFRKVQNFIGGFKMEQARFIPAPPDRVPGLMIDLESALQYEPDPESHYELGVLTRAPQVHAQFEAIHPFVDGNGRVGRLLLPLIFLADDRPPVHLATFLKLRQRDYYDALLEVQMKRRWTQWVGLFLECVIASCRHSMRLLIALQSVASEWHARLEERRTRRHATAYRLADFLLGQPVVTVSSIASRLNVSYPSANAAVAELVDARILHPKSAQRRNRAFYAREVLELLYAGVDTILADVGALRDYKSKPRPP